MSTNSLPTPWGRRTVTIFLSLVAIAFVLLFFWAREQDAGYKAEAAQFIKACEAKHRKIEWRRGTGYYCAEPNSVDFMN